MSDTSLEFVEVDRIRYAGELYRFEPPILVPESELVDGQIPLERAAAWVAMEGMENVQPNQLEVVKEKAIETLLAISLRGNKHIIDLAIVQLLEGRNDRKISRIVELN